MSKLNVSRMDIALFLALLALLIIAVGPIAGAGAVTPPDSLPAELDPVRVGLLLPLSGELAVFGRPMYEKALLAVRHINEQGGILGGRTLELLLEDTQSDPEHGVAAAHRLVADEHVAALIGAASSDVSVRVLTEVATPNKIVQISSASTVPELAAIDTEGYFFRIIPSDAMQGRVLGNLAHRLGYTRIAALYVDNAYGRGLVAHFAERFTAAGGRVTTRVPFAPGRASYAEELAQAGNFDPEALLLISYPQSGALILHEAAQSAHFHEFLLADGMYTPEVIDAFGPRQPSIWGTVPSSGSSDGLDPYLAAFTEMHGPQDRPIFALETYDAVFLIALAIEKAGVLSGPDIRDALRQTALPTGESVYPGEWERAVQHIHAGRPVRYNGASGPVFFDERGDRRGGLFGIWKIIDGQLRIVTYDLTVGG